MTRSPTAFALVLVFASIPAAAPAPVPRPSSIVPVDLKPHLNQKLDRPFHNDGARKNTLATLPVGKGTFASVPFTIGDGVMQLGSSYVKGFLPKIEGIEVGARAKKLHFLHACGCGDDPAGTVIGKYVVRYHDRTTAEVEIVYGKDVVDWWVQRGQKDATRSKVGWEGDNELTRAAGAKLKLSLTTWENPHPAKKVVGLDYLAAAGPCKAAPFCAAISSEY